MSSLFIRYIWWSDLETHKTRAQNTATELRDAHVHITHSNSYASDVTVTSQAAHKVITTVGITYEVGGRYTACQHSFQCRVPAEQTLSLLVRELYTKL